MYYASVVTLAALFLTRKLFCLRNRGGLQPHRTPSRPGAQASRHKSWLSLGSAFISGVWIYNFVYSSVGAGMGLIHSAASGD